jgi:hypothetical protein
MGANSSFISLPLPLPLLSLSLSLSQASAASYFSLLFFPFFLVSFVELAVGGRGYKKRRIDMNVLYVYSCLILLYFSAIFGIKIVLCYFFFIKKKMEWSDILLMKLNVLVK